MPPKDIKEIEECFLVDQETGEKIPFGVQLADVTVSDSEAITYGDHAPLAHLDQSQSYEGSATVKHIPVFIMKLVFGTNNWRRLHGWPQIRYGAIERWKRKYK